jgi:hypothetical protein
VVAQAPCLVHLAYVVAMSAIARLIFIPLARN